MEIAAAAPNWAWSDLAGMLIPNGHTLDYLADASYGPIGMPLESYVGFLFAAGGGLGYFAPPGVDFSSDADGWVARFLAGDPYDDSLSTGIVSNIRRYHSPLGVEAGLPRRRREEPAPVFDNTSWTDDLTRTTEILRWRNDVLTRYPHAEIDLLFSNGAGHPRASLIVGEGAPCRSFGMAFARTIQFSTPKRARRAPSGASMAKSEPIEVEGTVTLALPNAMFKLKLDGSDQEILGIVSGKMRKHFIRILPGDRVRVELSPYDLTKGRIVFRQK